jgi:hypothetical protein
MDGQIKRVNLHGYSIIFKELCGGKLIGLGGPFGIG